jgi:hypothetical protein
MEWIEPKEVAEARAALWNDWASLIPAALVVFLFGGLCFGSLTYFSLWLSNKLHLFNLIYLFGTIAGAITSTQFIMGRRFPVVRQVGCLGEHAVTITGNTEQCDEYQEFVGYCFIPTDIPKEHFDVLVFCKESGYHTSIGLPLSVSKEEVRFFLGDKLRELALVEVPEPKMQNWANNGFHADADKSPRR